MVWSDETHHTIPKHGGGSIMLSECLSVAETWSVGQNLQYKQFLNEKLKRYEHFFWVLYNLVLVSRCTSQTTHSPTQRLFKLQCKTRRRPAVVMPRGEESAFQKKQLPAEDSERSTAQQCDRADAPSHNCPTPQSGFTGCSLNRTTLFPLSHKKKTKKKTECVGKGVLFHNAHVSG